MPAAVRQPEALRVREVAAALALSPTSVRRRVADGTIHAAKIGGAVRIPSGEVSRLLGRGDR